MMSAKQSFVLEPPLYVNDSYNQKFFLSVTNVAEMTLSCG